MLVTSCAVMLTNICLCTKSKAFFILCLLNGEWHIVHICEVITPPPPSHVLGIQNTCNAGRNIPSKFPRFRKLACLKKVDMLYRVLVNNIHNLSNNIL